MGGSSEIMAGRGWRRQNYGWSWMVVGGGGAKLLLVVGGGGKIMASYGWS